MKLELNNIGIIKKADIKIDGLTVIAGENDSGKSTVGKVLYSLVKSIALANDTKFNYSLYEKYFNTYINKLFENQILILDEPEVHLHPKWQLKLAKV